MKFTDLELAAQLALARSGTDFFQGWLAAVTDDDFERDSALPGWSRKHLVAHVGHNAQALCRLMDWASTGVITPMYESADQRQREIAAGGGMDCASLCEFTIQSGATLDSKWDRLPGAAWSAEVRTAQGRTVRAQETIWMRTREVWIHAVDLANGARFDDLPHLVLTSLLHDITTLWRTRGVGAGIVVEVEGSPAIEVHPGHARTGRVTGPLAQVVRWASGRGSLGVDTDVDAPRWL